MFRNRESWRWCLKLALLVAVLASASSYAAGTMFSQIVSGGAVNVSTDQILAVRSGTLDRLVTLNYIPAGFANITSGVNTTAAMEVGSGATLTVDVPLIVGSSDSTTIGLNNTNGATNDAVVIGRGNTNPVGGDSGILLGAFNTNSGGTDLNLLMGYGNVSKGSTNISFIGVQNTDIVGQGTNAVAVGVSNQVEGVNSAAFGFGNTIGSLATAQSGSLAVGSSNSVTADNAVAIGANISNSTASSLQIGISNTAKITITSAALASPLPVVVTSAGAAAFAVGANGATNPVLTVDDSTTSVATGVAIKGAATGGTTTLTATDSGSNTNITVQSKGTGTAKLITPGSGNATVSSNSGNVILAPGSATYTFATNSAAMAQSSSSTGATVKYAFATGGSDTGITASTEAPVSTWESAQSSRSHATGALALQRDNIFYGNPDAFVGSSTLTNAATLAVVRKSAGTNATVTNSSAIYVGADSLSGTVTNSYGINVTAATGATHNYAALFTGGAVVDAVISGGTKYTASGCSNSSTVGGAAAGTFTSGTTGACTVVVTLNGATGSTAPNGWSCWVSDMTTGTAGAQTASSQTTATIKVSTTSGDTVTFGCIAY